MDWRSKQDKQTSAKGWSGRLAGDMGYITSNTKDILDELDDEEINLVSLLWRKYGVPIYTRSVVGWRASPYNKAESTELLHTLNRGVMCDGTYIQTCNDYEECIIVGSEIKKERILLVILHELGHHVHIKFLATMSGQTRYDISTSYETYKGEVAASRWALRVVNKWFPEKYDESLRVLAEYLLSYHRYKNVEGFEQDILNIKGG